jgi:hypothetical protein
MTLRMRRLMLSACVSVALLLTLFPATSVLTAQQQPDMQIIPVDETIFNFVSCGEFNVDLHIEGTYRFTNAGGLFTFQRHLHGTFTNDVTGFFLPLVVADTEKVVQSDENGEVIVVTGLQTKVTKPGEGYITGDAGKAILRFSATCPTCFPEVIFVAGQSTADMSFVPELCAALAE